MRTVTVASVRKSRFVKVELKNYIWSPNCKVSLSWSGVSMTAVESEGLVTYLVTMQPALSIKRKLLPKVRYCEGESKRVVP